MSLSLRPVCPINVKVHQDQNSARHAGFNGQVVPANKLEEIAPK